MKNTRLLFFLAFVLAAAMISCGKNGMSAPAGGDLPTHYIMVKDSTFTPPLLTLVSGSSITFVNNTAIPHSLMSDDSTTIKLVTIAPGTSYLFNKDTSGTFAYHCTLHPTARGYIILTP